MRGKRILPVIGFLAVSGLVLSGAVTAQAAEPGLRTLQDMQSAFRSIAQKVLPTVVEIDVVDVVKQSANPFNFFFGPNNAQPQQRKQFGLGSGVIVRKDGDKVYVLTNNHVAGNAERISVKLKDGRRFTGKLVGADPNKDLALVVFQTREDIPVAQLGDSDSLQVGDWVLAVGNPLGFSSTVTAGIVSATGRENLQGAEVSAFTDYIQTDAAINQGNSGGALVNIYGQVVGINTWIASPSGGNVGLGFAIPINNAKKVITDLLTKGKVEYGWLGIQVGNLPQASAKDLGAQNAQGAFVYGVFTGSPADRAGLEPGDYITSINGTSVQDAGHFLQAVGNDSPGSTVRFDLLREGHSRSLTVRLGTRPDQKALANQSGKIWPGMSVVGLTADISQQLNLPANAGKVVVAAVEQGSPAAVAGFSAGDVVRKINGKSVSSLEDFYSLLNQANRRLVVTVFRQGQEVVVGMTRP